MVSQPCTLCDEQGVVLPFSVQAYFLSLFRRTRGSSPSVLCRFESVLSSLGTLLFRSFLAPSVFGGNIMMSWKVTRLTRVLWSTSEQAFTCTLHSCSTGTSLYLIFGRSYCWYCQDHSNNKQTNA